MIPAMNSLHQTGTSTRTTAPDLAQQRIDIDNLCHVCNALRSVAFVPATEGKIETNGVNPFVGRNVTLKLGLNSSQEVVNAQTQITVTDDHKTSTVEMKDLSAHFYNQLANLFSHLQFPDYFNDIDPRSNRALYEQLAGEHGYAVRQYSNFPIAV
jgi:hypothetical protein